MFYIGKIFQSIWYKDVPLSVFVTLNFWFSVFLYFFNLYWCVCVSLGIMEEWFNPLFSHSLILHHRVERTEEMERNSKIT